jgi:hypothetical protein
MNVTTMIDGRLAVPLRAVPFMDGWNALHPERIVEWLAESALDSPPAFRVDESSAPIEHRFWSNTLEQFRGLVPAGAPRIEWQREAVKLLPVEVFMWLDDVRELFRASAGVQAYDHEPDFCLGDGPKWGKVHVGNGGRWTYFPNEGYAGRDTFTIEFDLAGGQKNVVPVVVEVSAEQAYIEGSVAWTPETIAIPMWQDGFKTKPLTLSTDPMIPEQLAELIKGALVRAMPKPAPRMLKRTALVQEIEKTHPSLRKTVANFLGEASKAGYEDLLDAKGDKHGYWDVDKVLGCLRRRQLISQADEVVHSPDPFKQMQAIVARR